MFATLLNEVRTNIGKFTLNYSKLIWESIPTYLKQLSTRIQSLSSSSPNVNVSAYNSVYYKLAVVFITNI